MAVPSDHQQRRSKKSKNGQKKQPQRGLGVAQLERLRIQEESKKAMLASSSFAAAGSCFQAQHGRVSALCLSAPHNPPLHLHHLSAAQQGSGGGAGAFRSSNVPFLASVGASARQHHKASLDPNLINISQHSSTQVIHQLDHALMAKIHGQASADSSSCKSGISSDASAAATVAASHHLFGRGSGRSSSSPSPCSSSQQNSKPDHVIDESDESSRGAATTPPFVFLGSSSSCSSEANHKNTSPLMIQPGTSISNNIVKNNLPEPSEMFDSSFRTRARRVYGDGRDWPGIHTHGIPAIKELSSFQIPGNTIPALSSPNKACWTGARDGAADMGSGYSDKGSSSVKIIAAASSSPRSLSAASSWARSEVCFSFEKDSCSSSLKNPTNSNTNLEATSSTKPASCDLTLALASPDPRPQIHKRPSSSSSGLPNLKFDDDESSKFVVTTQEASGETDDHWLLKNYHQLAPPPPRKSIKLQHSSSPSMPPPSPFMLELSLKVPSLEEESSLELKLAL